MILSMYENIERLQSEIQTLENEKADIIAKMSTTNDDITAKNKRNFRCERTDKKMRNNK